METVLQRELAPMTTRPARALEEKHNALTVAATKSLMKVMLMEGTVIKSPAQPIRKSTEALTCQCELLNSRCFPDY